MSGPPYPRYAPGSAPGQGAIGSFIIGQSPIGDVPPFDVWQTVISQYANSPILDSLVTNMAQYVDPTRDLDSFYDTMWNVDTAIGRGLDIWGRIVGVTRTLQIPGSQQYFGFEEAGALTFGQGTFFAGSPLANNFSLPDPSYRTLIFAKALANICDGSIPAINQLLLNLFHGRGNCFVVDNNNLTMVYTFNFVLSAVELAIVARSGVLPRTSGVSVTVFQNPP